MLFNSIDFAIFLPLFFIIYWFFGKNKKNQNILILIGSYIFYCWWDWRFLSLIILSTIVDYTVGLYMHSEKKITKRKILLWTSILLNIGLLGVFKYFNFFIENFIIAFNLLGCSLKSNTLNIILPVGISFYTFQTLSYTIDVYKKRLTPTNDFISFASYVTFFPQLVAGPIERAHNLLPQFYTFREFNYSKSVNGLKQILWGLFKKLVIADNCAILANEVFNNTAELNGSTLFLGAVFFAFQIYGDFSGYSDIAIGVAKLFGINLKQNFSYPYFSRDIAEFWRRWHISLSTWFRDYLYIPLGGSRGNMNIKIRNIFTIFLISGFWHGANWTFIAWGAINAIYFLPLFLTKKNRKHLDIVASNSMIPSLKELINMLTTFILTIIAWIFFRSDNLTHALNFINGIISISIISEPQFDNNIEALMIIILICFFIIIEWLGRKNKFAIENLFNNLPRYVRWIFYYIILIILLLFTPSAENTFIYFQF